MITGCIFRKIDETSDTHIVVNHYSWAAKVGDSW